MKSNLISFTPAEIQQHETMKTIKRDLGKQIDGNRAFLLAMILGGVLVWLAFGSWHHRSTEVGQGTVMDAYFSQPFPVVGGQ